MNKVFHIGVMILPALLILLNWSGAYAQTGACCVDFICVGTTIEEDCLALGGNWFEGYTCLDFDCDATRLCDDLTDVFWDNGDTDGSGGLSINANSGFYHAVLDDINLDERFVFAGFHQTLVWESLQPPQAASFDLLIHRDVGGVPGDVIEHPQTILISEAPTGREFLGRIESVVSVLIDPPLALDPGTYWLEMHIGGPDDCLALAMSDDGYGDEIIGMPIWVNYEEYGGLRSGIDVFGEEFGVNFCLTDTTIEFPCGPYVAGDYNGSGGANVADVVEMFSRLKTGAPSYPGLDCECPPESGNLWAVRADANKSCTFNVADVIYLFNSIMWGPPPEPCAYCPPGP